MFATAKTLTAPKTNAKKNAKAEIALEGLNELAAIDAAIKALTALKESFVTDVNAAACDHFIAEGLLLGRRPDNFVGVADEATASIELRQRASTSKLSDEEIAYCAANNIPTRVEVETVETFVINPAYKDDQAILGKVEKALKTVKGLPEDFILLQAGKSKTVVDNEAIDAVFAANKGKDVGEKAAEVKAAVKAALKVVAVQAVKPKFTGSTKDALELALGLVDAD